MNFKRRSIIMMILVFSSLFVLGAQTRPSIAIRALSGGSGNDGELIAVMLSTQRVIQNNFTITDGASDYEITGTIVRDGLGHIAHIVIYRGGTEIGRESLFYRAFIEVSAYMPTIAASLARSADSSIAAPSNVRSLPQAPEAPAVATAPVVTPPPRPATPAATPPVSTPPPAPTQRLPLPTQRVPAPQPDTGADEESTRRGPPTPMTFYTGAFLGLSGIGLEVSWFPSNRGLHWLGFRYSLSSWNGGSDWERESGHFSWNSHARFQGHNAHGAVNNFGATGKFRIGMFNLNLNFGYSVGSLNFDEYDYQDKITVQGFHWGTDFGMGMGPGIIFLTLHGSVLFGGGFDVWAQNTDVGIYNTPYHVGWFELNSASYVNFGVCYRIGFGAKPPRE